MKNIGFYTSNAQSTSIYAEAMTERYNIFSLTEEQSEQLLPKMDAVFIDYTSISNKERVNNIYLLLATIRKTSEVTIFVLLQEASKVERLICLQFGANGVFDREVVPDEVLLILGNLFRCQKYMMKSIPQGASGDIPRALQLRPDFLSVCLENGEEVFLTRLEYRLLEHLKEKASTGSTYEEIHQFLWPKEEKCKQYRVANMIFHLRMKIEKQPSHPQYIKTIRTVGYLLQESGVS